MKAIGIAWCLAHVLLTTAEAQSLVNAVIDKEGTLHIGAAKNSSEHDFDFLEGDWQSNNRRLSKRLQGSNEWTTSKSLVNNRRFLHGISNLDICRTLKDGVPFETISFRIFNPRTRLWSSYWIGEAGVMDPPVVGSFEQNIGTFYGKTVWEGKSVLVMYRWDKINPQSPRWNQSYSTDNGKNWELNMENVSARPINLPQVFSPGIISTDSSEFGSAFSADGNTFYFARSVNKRSGIFVTRKLKDGWSNPETRIIFKSQLFRCRSRVLPRWVIVFYLNATFYKNRHNFRLRYLESTTNINRMVSTIERW